jgi:hypothetical protein
MAINNYNNNIDCSNKSKQNAKNDTSAISEYNKYLPKTINQDNSAELHKMLKNKNKNNEL